MSLSSNPIMTQTIDIYVIGIPELYDFCLCRDWSYQLNIYFSTDWPHVWFPWNGQENKINFDRKKYMKYIVNKLEGPNELIMFNHSS